MECILRENFGYWFAALVDIRRGTDLVLEFIFHPFDL
jgi:hypothetical protein